MAVFDLDFFSNEGLTNLLFPFEDVKFDFGKLEIWRIKSHEAFGGTWLSGEDGVFRQ